MKTTNGTWESVKAGYLKQVEKALSSAGHRERKQVLEDVRNHLDQRFGELGADEQTWENMQAIITEMGPATDYAELLAPETLTRSRSIGLRHFWWVAAIAIVIAAGVFLLNLMPHKVGYIIRFVGVEPFKPVTAKQLLDEFNRNHPRGIRTHHFRTIIRGNKLEGLICVDNEAAKEVIVNMIDKNKKLILIEVKAVTEKDLGIHYALGQPSLRTVDLKKDYIPETSAIDERGRIVDKMDYPFEDDPQIIGEWESVDFVSRIEHFDPQKKRWPGELFLKEMVFFEDGHTGGPWSWTKGLVIHPGDRTSAKYEIREIDNSKYMFFEWKSGDYTIRHQKPHYYVLKKEPVGTDIAVVDLKVRGCYDDQLRAKGFYDVTASIRNKSEQQTDQFGVYFYRGDPARRKPRTHAAGPIKSGGTWNEYTGPFELQEGTNVFSVVIDPGNKINDPDRSNNTKTIKVTVKDGRIAEETIIKKPLSGFVSSDKTPSHPLDFQVTSSDFIKGDWIEITKLMGTSPQIKTGEKYAIRGKYRLVSHDTAQLRIYATDGEVSSSQGPDVKRGEGEFTRTFTLLKEGSKNLSYLHLSFYPAEGGSGFGNTYFKQKKAADDKIVESSAKAIRAVKAAQAWLKLIDDGDYGKSWEEAAEVFKNAATKERWEGMAITVRQPLGKVISRKVMSKMPTKTVPGGPDGEYVIIQFKTTFENKSDAIETVTPMLDKNGVWRVTGYYIR